MYVGIGDVVKLGSILDDEHGFSSCILGIKKPDQGE